MAVAGPSCRRPAGRPAARRRRGPWAAGLGSRRDRGAVPPVGPARPLPPQARPPWLLPGPGVGLAVQRAPGPGGRGPAVAAAATAGPQRPPAVPGLGGVPARDVVDLR